MSAFAKSYENILTSRPESGVALVTLNRPKALNALNTALFAELNDALRLIDSDREIGAIVITGSERAFAGAYQHHHNRCIERTLMTGCRTGGCV
jgi:enoyl-CoA hydratase